VANESSEHILLTIARTHPGHNAGDIAFGPDGYLYIPLGDGDSSMITDRPQDPTTLLGKVIRINVNDAPEEGAADCKGAGSGNYSIPLSNPYHGSATACDEIWARGMRNPWRLSFDRVAGDLYLSDVGEAAWDELNFRTAGSAGGQNYGWPCYEAHILFEPERCAPGTEFTFPALVQAIGAENDCSLTGGYVYRGTLYPELVGRYFMADYCSGNVRDALRSGDEWVVTLHPALAPFGVVSFGQGNDGELYVVNRENNSIYRLVGDGSGATPTSTTPPGATATHTPSSTPPNSTATATPSATKPGTPGPTVTITPTASATASTGTPAATPSPTMTRPVEWSEHYYLSAVFATD
jgi:glucose/arabinose dehydrogenase